tara:strand:+ start:11 stop:1282 length:1272 start_codon:yes stop_codon:yes gene_type:complete
MKLTTLILTVFLTSNLLAQEMYTLETCETDIAYNVPQFYQDFFHCVKARVSESGDYVNLYFNAKPPYQTWYYDERNIASSDNPNWIPFESFGPGSYQNPNVIVEQDYVISIPVNPVPRSGITIDASTVDGEVNTSNYEYPMGTIGAALNGVTMFNSLAAPGDVIENEVLSFDLYNGHPAGETYHYHTISQGPLEVLQKKLPTVVTNSTPGSAELEIYGINCDGVVIMGCTELNGSSIDTANYSFDAQNGHVHDMIGEDGTEYFTDRYHTHMCYTEITDEDTDGDGYAQHEFSPEISYYKTPNLGVSNDRCGAMSSPIEPDAVLGLDIDAIPNSFVLYNNYPNPFNPETVIDYDLPESGFVNITVYDINGRKIKELMNSSQSAGFKSVTWDATNMMGQPISAGMYLYTIQTDNFLETKKMMYIK